LLADDNGDTREMYSLYLDMAGYHVEVVADGQEAVAAAGRLRPDVIVTDLDTPKVDGWAAMKQLHRDAATARIPIVVLTGHDLKAYLKPAALAAGAVSYVMKHTDRAFRPQDWGAPLANIRSICEFPPGMPHAVRSPQTHALSRRPERTEWGQTCHRHRRRQRRERICCGSSWSRWCCSWSRSSF